MRTVVILCNRFSKYNAQYIFVNLDDNLGNQNEGGVNKLNSSVCPSINILHENHNNGHGEVPAVFVPTGEGNSLDKIVFHLPKHFTHSVSDDETLPRDKSDVREAQTLLNSNDSNNNKTSSGSSCTDLNKLNRIDDDDDEPIPSSQDTSSTSSKQKRRSRISRTPKNSKKQSLSGENSKIIEPRNAKSLVSSPYFTNENRSADVETKEIAESNKTDEPTLETKKQTSPKMSPISSRTRFRRNPTPYKPRNDKTSKSFKSSKQEETTEPDLSTAMEEFSDHQMDDTQLLEDTVVQVVSNKSSDNHAKEETVEKLKNEAPSSPVASSSVKFVHSKTSATGSPLNRPHRAFSSPACSPTTGILKRNRGKSETPSPPGKVDNTLLIQ